MSSGLSMTSVNKIKELASAHEYSLAAPILDSQDLEQSYNPQFLRVCGEVYENVGRLRDARRLYVKAHTLAPEATRIIFSLINFYLKKGYFDLADRYFEEYVHFSSGYGRELQNIKYIMKKAKSPDLEELMFGDPKYLEKTYLLVAHNGIARGFESWFREMTIQEYANGCRFGNCELIRREFE